MEIISGCILITTSALLTVSNISSNKKILFMLPDNILQSDVLDIVFENRNKAYGAYTLRKNYPQRLWLALASMAGAVLIFSFLQFEIKPGNKNISVPMIDTVQITPVQLSQDKIIKKKAQKNTVKPLKQSTQIKDLVPVIAKNNIIDTMPAIEQLNVNQIASQTLKGDEPGSPQVAAMSNGNSNSGEIKTDEPAIFKTAEIMPQFPGGIDALENFLRRNIKQPDDLNADEKLVVKAKFVVDADGSISGIEILQSARNDLDADVVRVLHKMPKWIPGIQNGKNIAVYFQLPVTFVGTEQ